MIDDGHLFMVTQPAQTAAIVEEFLVDETKQTRKAGLLRDSSKE